MQTASPKLISLAGLQARDRRKAALHEAGHLVIARHLGFRGCVASLSVNPDGGLYERHRVGQISYPREAFQRLSPLRRAMLGVAGMVAEEAWRCRGTPDALRGECWEDHLWDPACLSEADWACAGSPPGEPCSEVFAACERVAALFDPGRGPLWPSLRDEARGLILTTRR